MGSINHHRHFTTSLRRRLYVVLTLFGLKKWKVINPDSHRQNLLKISICRTVHSFRSMMSLGLFIAGFGAMFRTRTYLGSSGSYPRSSLWTFVSMGVRSLKDDLGFYVKKEDILRDMKRKGGQK